MAGHHLNAIDDLLKGLNFAKAPGFEINGLKHVRLFAADLVSLY